MFIDFTPFHLLLGLALLALLLVALWRRTRSFSYLFFFTIFWIYLLAVVQVVIFPIYIAVEDELVRNIQHSINLIPFYFGRCNPLELCIRNIYENILLTIPFGFGFPFIVAFKSKNFFRIAVMVGLLLEFSQLLLSWFFHSAFRVVDINDVILNAFGVLLGYALFILFARTYLTILEHFKIQPVGVFAYIRDIVIQNHPKSSSLSR